MSLKIVNKEAFTKSMKDLVEDLNKTAANSQISVSLVDKKEANNTIWYMLSLKPTCAEIAKEKYWIGVYLFETNSGVNTFVVNGRQGELLFENKTANAPEIALVYIKQILTNEDAFIGKRAEAVKKLRMSRKGHKKPQNANGKKKIYTNSSSNGQKKSFHSYGAGKSNQGGKKPYNGKGGTYQKKSSGNNGTGTKSSKFKPYYMTGNTRV